MKSISISRNIAPLISSDEVIEINGFESYDSLREILNVNSKVILLGEPGVGKSYELEKLFQSQWDIRNDTQIYPIIITLKKYHCTSTFEDLIPFKDWKRLSNIIFILDGLDETAYPHDFISVLELFINLHKGKNYKFIISSRTNIYLNYQLQLESFKPFKLNPLDADQINTILENEGAKTDKINQEFIDKYPFYSSPFFLKVVINYYQLHNKWIESENEIWSYFIDNELNAFELKERKKRKVLIPKEKKMLKLASLVNELQGRNQFKEEELFALFGEQYINFIVNPFISNSDINEPVYSFKHRQYQEYFASLVLKELTFKELKEIINIDKVNKVRPSLTNVTSLLLSISDDCLFKELSEYLFESDIEILIKSDSLRISNATKFSLFKEYFTSKCLEKKLWLGTHSNINEVELAQFADSTESFTFLIDIIKNKELNNRARVSAINLLKEFKSIDDDELVNTIYIVLDSEGSLSFKSGIIRLINTLPIEKRISSLKQIIDRNPEESNKEWNRSLIAILSKLEYIDEFFNYLQREFMWANKIVHRKDNDQTHRGNSWLMMDLILRLNDASNFIELATFYFEDYNLRTQEPFRENLINKCIEFETDSPGFIVKLIEKIQKREKIRSSHNDDVLTELIKKSNKELDAFKIIYNQQSSDNIDTLTLAKISTKETVDYFLEIMNAEDAIKLSLQGYRNMITNYGQRDLAIYLEDKLKEKGIDIGDKVPTEKEVKEKQSQLAKEVQENANLLFNNSDLIQKIKNTLIKKDSDLINAQIVRKLERSYYKIKENWFRGLGCEFDILYAAMHLEHTFSINELKEKLENGKQIQLIALKGMLESNKGAQFKFELSKEQIESIKEWLSNESQKFKFEELIQSETFDRFTITRMSDYQFLKNIYYFMELDEFSGCFNQDFLLNSISYYRMEESEPFSEHFDKLIFKIQSKVALKKRVIQNIKSKIFTFPKERLVVYALNNDYTEVYKEIGEFLELSSNYPGDKIFDLYKLKNRVKALELIEKITKDLNSYKGWSALKELSDIESKKDYCIACCKEYLSSEETEFKSNALAILFKLDDPEALIYFIEGIGTNPLYNIAHKYRVNYSIPIESFLEKFDKLFIPIYQTKEVKDEFDRDWEFTENNTFFTQIITNVLKESNDKAEAFEQLKQKLIDVQKSTEDDNIIFYSNSITEFLTNIYISLMSRPMSFEEALALTNEIIK